MNTRVGYSGGVGGGGSEPTWQMVTVTTVHRNAPGPGQLGPIVPLPGIVVWTPPFPCFIRGFTVNDDENDPLTGASDSVAFGVTQGPEIFFTGIGPGVFGANIIGWGADEDGTTQVQLFHSLPDAGIVMAPAGSVPGRPLIRREMIASVDSASLVGTLHFRFEMRPFAGAW